MPTATFPLKQLTAAVSAAATVAPTRTTKDILKNIRVWFRGDGAELSATDSEISLTRIVTATDCRESATFLIDAQKLLQMLRLLNGESVTITVEKQQVAIEAGFAFFQLTTADARDFPPVAITPPEESIVIRTDALIQVLSRTVFAADVESTRYALGGVQLEWDGAQLIAAATDSRRLAVASELAAAEEFPSQVLDPVPKRALQALVSALQGQGDVVRIGRVNDTVIFSAESVRLSAQCVQGRFPDWRRVNGNVEKPINCLTTANHVAHVRAFLMKYYGQGVGQECSDPMHTVVSHERFGLVQINGQDFEIVDIGMRMLTARELFRAQGFPDGYRIAVEHNGRLLPKSSQVRMCGNSVCPQLAAALVKANCPELARQKRTKQRELVGV